MQYLRSAGRILLQPRLKSRRENVIDLASKLALSPSIKNAGELPRNDSHPDTQPCY